MSRVCQHCLSVACLSVCLLPVCLSVCCLSVCLSVACLSVCLSGPLHSTTIATLRLAACVVCVSAVNINGEWPAPAQRQPSRALVGSCAHIAYFLSTPFTRSECWGSRMVSH
ncbi:hypothetical protein BDZ91DRAFT_737841 [Kalaharituber pfeilii]|nr:hypothetical protein BDZ91DRAFT_737841 [Kalaharituber pfeilii]